jgi:hypothetical protein
VPGEDDVAVDARRARALEEPLDVRLDRAVPYPQLEVRNPIHGTAYLVLLPESPARTGALCTCTDFARRGLGTCKHIEAGVRWWREHPDATPLRPVRTEASDVAAVWRRVDRRIAAVAREAGGAAQRWRRAGAVLFERSSDG